jgi:hypothetical protein
MSERDETILHEAAVEDVIAEEYEALSVPFTSTTTKLADIDDPINTVDKHTGKMVFNVTTGLPVWAVDGTAGGLWNTAAGATAHTPV